MNNMKTPSSFYSLSMLIWMVIILNVYTTASQPLSANQIDDDSEETYEWLNKEKRPFCNAFAGCGRKRANLSIRESRNPSSYGKASQNHPGPLNHDASQILDKLYARIQHYRTNTGQLDENDYK